ncbi:MrpH family fimbial adhesin [Lelliottia nimipressuralis]|uniref:MrpH family fimbial adhesin n=1 Tax=Lelliottia nimipressuralis TaxID=69220 RepID=UPI00289F94F7|nr:hypothetical protein [Lelliottia nimipressuralis]
MKYLYISMALILWTTESGAITYPWKIVSSIDIRIIDSTAAEYTLHMTDIMITDDSIGAGDTLQSIMRKKTGLETGFGWGTYHRHNAKTGVSNPTPSASATFYYIPPGDTIRWKSFADFLTQTTPSVIINNHNGSPNGNECVGSTIWSSTVPTSNFDTWLAKTWNGGAGDSGTCLGTPPANQWCALSTAVVDVDFGEIHVSEAAGTTANDNINVECTTGMKYTIRLRGVDAIPLSNGMKAEITANGMQLNSTLDGLEGDNPVQLTTKLAGTPNSDGAFEGSGVLFISYP